MVMHPANSTKHFFGLTRSTPIFILEERLYIYIYISYILVSTKENAFNSILHLSLFAYFSDLLIALSLLKRRYFCSLVYCALLHGLLTLWINVM